MGGQGRGDGGDGAGPQSYEPSVEKEKAYTAVSWNAPTSDLVKRLANARR
ncbi:hypothetical protein GCM10010282_69080 [Streptomyces roseolus]|nr:hypothetical protein GCM10010282_69080 [Streptomyces roseolus]